MNNISKIIICSLAFIMSSILAYFVTCLVVGKNLVPAFIDKMFSSSKTEMVVASNKGVPAKVVVDDTVKVDVNINNSHAEPTISVVARGKQGDKYNIQVKCENLQEGIVVSYKVKELKISTNDGNFTNLPGCQNGEYTFVATNTSTNDIVAEIVIGGFIQNQEEATVQKMSVRDFQRLLLNQNDNSLLGGKNPRVARYVRFTCVGLHEGDYPAEDVQHVRDKIANDIWKSAVVTNVGYNERGQINSATITPVYYE